MTTPPSSLFESSTVATFYGSAEMRAVFNDRALVQSWLSVEGALARAQARLGIIPDAAARRISAEAQAERHDIAQLTAEAAGVSHPLVPLIRSLTRACGEDAGRYVHFGATTQDVMDTGLVMSTRSALAVVERQVGRVMHSLRRLATKHRDSVMAARTHGQQALPTTFGLRCAVWLAEFTRHEERLAELRPRVLVTSMGGAAGTMAGYGEQALSLERALADELDLDAAPAPWHSSPDSLVECALVLSLIAGSVEKLAREVYFLGRTEIGEASESQSASQVGSSTMPHKRNPIRSEAVIAACSTMRSQAALALQAMVGQDDRDMGAGIVLWKLIPESFLLIGGALERMGDVLGDLVVDTRRMRENLGMTGGMILSEAVMLRLAKTVGRERAHAIVTSAVRQSLAEARPFADVLRQTPEITSAIPETDLVELLEPSTYTGQAAAIVSRVLLKTEST